MKFITENGAWIGAHFVVGLSLSLLMPLPESVSSTTKVLAPMLKTASYIGKLGYYDYSAGRLETKVKQLWCYDSASRSFAFDTQKQKELRFTPFLLFLLIAGMILE